MTADTPFIHLDSIEKTFSNGKLSYHALKGVNLSIDRGELVALVGPSGSGKSTAMHLMGLLDTPSKGRYLLDGLPTSQLTSDERAHWRNEKIGFIFQQFFLLPKFNALNNVVLPLRYRKEKLENPIQIARDRLADVSMLPYEAHRPYELSGGQQQRVAIARALVSNPDIILADEPTGALDSKTSADVLDLLKEINQARQTTIIIVTHDHHVAQQCDRIIQIHDGLIVDDSVSTGGSS